MDRTRCSPQAKEARVQGWGQGHVRCWETQVAEGQNSGVREKPNTVEVGEKNIKGLRVWRYHQLGLLVSPLENGLYPGRAYQEYPPFVKTLHDIIHLNL